jgi:glucose uptake protein
MFIPGSFAIALMMTVMSAVFWGSWANTYKATKHYRFELFYWDYITGVVLLSFGLALTLGSMGATGEGFISNLRHTSLSNCLYAFIAGFIFNIANLLLVAGIDIAGLAVAFPIAIGIALVEGVVLSYILQPKGNGLYLAVGVALAIAAILCDAMAYNNLGVSGRKISPKGIVVNVVAGLLMGVFPPLVTKAMTNGYPPTGHLSTLLDDLTTLPYAALTPYSIAALFSLGAFVCCFFVNIYFMRHPLVGAPVNFSGYWPAGARNHVAGIAGGIVWGLGTTFNFIAGGFVGVAISYAIGQSAPMIAALWGVLAWKEFAGAGQKSWVYLGLMFVFYVAAVTLIALAYQG